MIDDRRRAKRYKARLPIKIESSPSDIKAGQIYDISSGGIFIPTDDPLPILSEIAVRIFLPDGDEEGYLLKGKVVRVVKSEVAKEKNLVAGMGIQFTDIEDNVKEQLRQFLKTVSFLLEGKKEGSTARSILSEFSISPIERRKKPRHLTKLKLKFKDEESLKEEYVKNISQGGVFVKTSKKFKRGQDVCVTLIHPVSGEEFDLNGTVVAVIDEEKTKEDSELTKGISIKFDDMGHSTKQKLEDFIDQIVSLSVDAELEPLDAESLISDTEENTD